MENNKKFKQENEDIKRTMYEVDNILKQTREELMETLKRQDSLIADLEKAKDDLMKEM